MIKTIPAFEFNGQLYRTKELAKQAQWEWEMQKVLSKHSLNVNSSIADLMEKMKEDILEVLNDWEG